MLSFVNDKDFTPDLYKPHRMTLTCYYYFFCTDDSVHYDSSLWTNTKPFNPKGVWLKRDQIPTCRNTSFSKICLGCIVSFRNVTWLKDVVMNKNIGVRFCPENPIWHQKLKLLPCMRLRREPPGTLSWREFVTLRVINKTCTCPITCPCFAERFSFP